jgi:hypothetical protein
MHVWHRSADQHSMPKPPACSNGGCTATCAHMACPAVRHGLLHTGRAPHAMDKDRPAGFALSCSSAFLAVSSSPAFLQLQVHQTIEPHTCTCHTKPGGSARASAVACARSLGDRCPNRQSSDTKNNDAGLPCLLQMLCQQCTSWLTWSAHDLPMAMPQAHP